MQEQCRNSVEVILESTLAGTKKSYNPANFRDRAMTPDQDHRPSTARGGTVRMRMKLRTETIVLAADLAGTFVFAVEGALIAARSGLDLFGVLVISFASALGGGVIRDVLLGATPPSAIRDWRYPAIAFTGGLLTFIFHSAVTGIPAALLIVLDAAGLSLFAVAGVEKALLYGINPFIATLMGTITGVGGGVLRDMMLTRVPAVLQVDIYATAAFIGALVVVGARRLQCPMSIAALAGGLVCFVVRLLAVWQHWALPRAGGW
jgi:uncharacterized membrane protein YeiH